MPARELPRCYRVPRSARRVGAQGHCFSMFVDSGVGREHGAARADFGHPGDGRGHRSELDSLIVADVVTRSVALQCLVTLPPPPAARGRTRSMHAIAEQLTDHRASDRGPRHVRQRARAADRAHRRGCRKARRARAQMDGAHVPGAMPLDIEGVRRGLGTSRTCKWGMAPPQLWLLWAAVAPPPDRPHPAVVSWGSTPASRASSAWMGTRDPSAWLAAPAGFDFLESLASTRSGAGTTCSRGAARVMARWGTAFETHESMIGCMATVALPASADPHERTRRAARSRCSSRTASRCPCHARRRAAHPRRLAYNEPADYEHWRKPSRGACSDRRPPAPGSSAPPQRAVRLEKSSSNAPIPSRTARAARHAAVAAQRRRREARDAHRRSSTPARRRRRPWARSRPASPCAGRPCRARTRLRGPIVRFAADRGAVGERLGRAGVHDPARGLAAQRAGQRRDRSPS